MQSVINQREKASERTEKTIQAASQGNRQHLATRSLKALEGRYLTRVRRRKVYVLRLKGYTIREMAAELKTGLHQIVEDLRAIDDALEKNIDTSQATRILNETLLEWEALKIMAIEGARNSDGNQQIGYMNTAVKINELQAKLLQDAGVLRKATERHEVTGPDGAPVIVQGLPAPKVVMIVEKDATTDDKLALAHSGRG
jgi:hypothetical protein